MKTKLHTLFIALALIAGIYSATAQSSTAFTYQGQLMNNGSLASGIYNLSFALFPTNSAGTAVAGPVTNLAVVVANGLFTTTIDFGPGVFNGTNYWLEIAVATNGANNFATLTPRQQLTPVPYALFAMNGVSTNGTVSANSLALQGGGSTWSFAVDTNGTLTIGDGEVAAFRQLLTTFFTVTLFNAAVNFAEDAAFEKTVTFAKDAVFGGNCTIGGWNIFSAAGNNPLSYVVGGNGVFFLFPPSYGNLPNTSIPQAGQFIGGIRTIAVAYEDGSIQTSGSPIPNVEVFNGSGTFVVPSGVAKIMVEVWGGGGGGGDGDDSGDGGGGGGAGGYGKGVFHVNPGEIYNVAVGFGGGVEGGTTSFGGLISASGGFEGSYGFAGGDGGGSGALISIDGGSGGNSGDGSFFGGAGGNAGCGGSGGRGDFGNGAGSGIIPGGGGGGGVSFYEVDGDGGDYYMGFPGAPGAPGRVIVYY